MNARRTRERVHLMPWVLLLLWIGIIWGHSLIPGAESDQESYLMVGAVQRLALWLFQNDNPTFARLIGEHPGVVRLLTDPAQLNHYVRKAAHFSEYFVLGMLALNAVRSSVRNPVLSLLLLGTFWAGVPYVDETIQRYVPYRSGQLSDVLLDMSGFGLAMLLWMVVACLTAPIRALFGAGGNEGQFEEY